MNRPYGDMLPMRVRWKHGEAIGMAIHPVTVTGIFYNERPGAYVLWGAPSSSLLMANMPLQNLVFRVPCGRRVINEVSQ